VEEEERKGRGREGKGKRGSRVLVTAGSGMPQQISHQCACS
jgi:hypothetical protein